ncbi:hypothetical protein FHW96_004124 [Novosphingobium sp. SG751A]|uniref:hypothetical protein n=1 Tax=Novosphingobium sp. SG751A TaxID=2587000 RepID=UPI001558118E|nr:hypothetical protein [Novosphingobium sp. SG751A]NOW47940.1 hypothetical protein [Novosphingobium sp. SG751A]
MGETSGDFLIRYLQKKQSMDDDALRIALAQDVHIKQWSYGWLNKVFFVLAMLLSVAVMVWPLMAVTINARGVDAAVAQTVVTALDGFAIYFYQFYKKRQVLTENLLRRIVFSDLPVARLVDAVIEEMSRIDQGFGFPAGGKKHGEGEEHRPVPPRNGPSKPRSGKGLINKPTPTEPMPGAPSVSDPQP